MSSVVYWIHLPEHTDMFTQGYIGVCNDIKKRLNEHKNKTNKYFENVIKKYGWDNLVKQQIIVAEMNYCLEMESKLRPNDRMGWNLVKGGGKPPVAFGNKNRLGKPAWNKGLRCTMKQEKKLARQLRNKCNERVCVSCFPV